MKVLFVCTANVCRSPLAEGYFNALVEKRALKGVHAASSGIAAFAGAPAFECAVDVAKENQFDISGHRARQLTPELAEDYEVILCMETWQASAVMEMHPKLSSKVSLLGSYHPEGKVLFQIPDPRDFNVPETLRTFDLIRRSVEGLLQSVPTTSL